MCVSAFAAGGDSRATTLVVLVAIGIVACLASAAVVGIDLRGHADDIQLATVRGMSRGRTWRWLVAERLLVVLAAIVAGSVLGAAAVTLLVAAGREGPDDVGPIAASAVGIGLVSVLTVAVCCGLVARSTPVRPERTPAWLTALESLVLLAAAWTLLQAGAAGRGEHRVLVACAPIASALAVIVVSRWLVRGLGAVGTLATARTRSIARYLATRRLRRATALGTAFACVASAAVMVVFGLSTRQAEVQWRTDMANIATGGVIAYESDLSAAATLLATREADPDGRWLMAIEASAPDVDADDYRGFADLTRWNRVVGPAWPDGAHVGDAFGADTWNPISLRSGKVRVRVDNQLDWPRGERPYVNLSLLGRDGELVSAGLALHNGRDVLTGTVSGCDEGCVLRNMSFGTEAEAPATLSGEIVLQEMSIDGESVTTNWNGADQTWRPDLATTAAKGEPLSARTTPAGLQLRLDTRGLAEPAGLTPSSQRPARRVVAAGDTRIGERVLGLDPAEAPADVVERARILPLIGQHGYLGNLPDVVLDSFEEAPGSRVRVFARDDTPDDVLTALSDQGIPTGDSTTASDVATALADADEGRAALGWIVLAVVVAVAASAVAAYTYGDARTRFRLDTAGLRSTHVPLDVHRAAARYEIVVVSLATTTAALVVGLVTWWCTRDALVLAAPTRFDPAVAVSTPVAATSAVAVVATLVAAGTALLVRRRDVLTSKPDVLRRGDGR